LKADLKDGATSVQVRSDVMLEHRGVMNLNDVLAFAIDADRPRRLEQANPFRR
jgi:hypothetical protein